RQDGWCQISVRDNGTGLAGHLAQDPFVPFLTTKKDGMGIGLSVCRTIAEVHGGTLSFEETERGAHVVFALPPA
ncbi:MAG: ATP-binding protein, partial [Roseobacter sp.]